MNVKLDRNYKKAADSGIFADNTLSASETQTPNRGLHHLSTTYHNQTTVPTVEIILMKNHQNGVRTRSRGNGREATHDQS